MLHTSTPSPSVASPTMIALNDVLDRLSLTQYFDVLTDNGFNTWDTVLDITEDDLSALGFKMGHRRILQREIASFRGIPTSTSLDLDADSNAQPQHPASPFETLARNNSAEKREKRRYRRHPKPDRNAPKKPRTAYVNFADHLRTDPSISNLSFVDIAREVGRKWQELPGHQKCVWESQAARAMQEYEAQMDEYKKTEPYRRHQAYLDDFKAQQAQAKSGKRSITPPLPRDFSHESSTPPLRRNHSDNSTQSSDYSASVPSTASTDAELCHSALTLAFNELMALRIEIRGHDQHIQTYNQYNLPPEGLIRRAMYAFVRGTGSLLYMWTYPQVDDILEHIYRPQKPVDALTLAECFTVAAMGAHYDMDCFPDPTRRSLYVSANILFNEKSATVDYLRTMRLLLSLSFYALLEKHLSARYLVAAGLQIARWKCVAVGGAYDPKNEVWRKIFRTLIFMDCWLSYTLGYDYEVRPEDINFACVPRAADTATMDEIIHVQTSKIGLVAAEIAKTLATPAFATRENVDMLTRKLETWRMEVPEMLQISVLTSASSPELTLYQRRAILMVHIMYLGALILLYRQLLIALNDQNSQWSLELSVEDVKKYRNECAVAAEQVARTLRLISYDGTLTKRCWLIIYWAFTACIVLLFSATSKILDGAPQSVANDLVYAKNCLDILEPCRSYEPVAAKYLDILWPFYHRLREAHQRSINRQKTSIMALLQPSDSAQLGTPVLVSREEMTPMQEKLADLLMDPFGRKQAGQGSDMRRILTADGSCIVFWFK